MKRITISLPDNLAAELAREGLGRRMPMSEIARDAIALHLAHLGAERIVDGKRILPFAGIGTSRGRGPSARDMDQFLQQEWTVKKMVDPYRSTREAESQEPADR